MSRVLIGVTPFRVLISLLITYLLSPLPLQVRLGFRILGLRGLGFQSSGCFRARVFGTFSAAGRLKERESFVVFF